MKKLLVLLTYLTLLFASTARAGTCVSSAPDTLPQTSGSGGALPPNLPGQVSPGFITHMEATGGPSISFTYTPTSGAPVNFSISFGASSGVSCTSAQAGGWTGTRIHTMQWFDLGAYGTQIILNGSTQPFNVMNCTGMRPAVGYAPNVTFGSGTGDGVSMITTGPGTQGLAFSGYRTASGANFSYSGRMVGSCHLGDRNADSYTDMELTNNSTNEPRLWTYGSGGFEPLARPQ